MMTTPECTTPSLRKYLNQRLEYKGNPDAIKLAGAPTIELFRYLNTLEIEVGLYELFSQWYLLAGEFGSFPIYDVPEESEIIIHSHPRMKNLFHSLPSAHDFIHTPSLTARHFVVSGMGISRFWPIKPMDSHQYMEIYALGEKQILPYLEENLLKELRGYGCKWVMYPWGKIQDQETLMKILHEE